MMLGKLQRAHPTLRGHLAPAYIVGSNMLRAYQLFIYASNTRNKNDFGIQMSEVKISTTIYS